MPKWEYMFVRHFDNRIMAIKFPGSSSYQEFGVGHQSEWEGWLTERGLEGWELVSEYTLNKSNSKHATLKRPIEGKT